MNMLERMGTSKPPPPTPSNPAKKPVMAPSARKMSRSSMLKIEWLGYTAMPWASKKPSNKIELK